MHIINIKITVLDKCIILRKLTLRFRVMPFLIEKLPLSMSKPTLVDDFCVMHISNWGWLGLEIGFIEYFIVILCYYDNFKNTLYLGLLGSER